MHNLVRIFIQLFTSFINFINIFSYNIRKMKTLSFTTMFNLVNILNQLLTCISCYFSCCFFFPIEYASQISIIILLSLLISNNDSLQLDAGHNLTYQFKVMKFNFVYRYMYTNMYNFLIP